MRVKFRDRIYACSCATRSGKLLLLTTFNGVYVVDCKKESTATMLYEDILRHGWIDVTYFEYSN